MHNAVIRPVQLTAEEVVERAASNYLTLAYVDDTLVGNATVRAPHDGHVMVIVRILPEYRRQGFGSEYLRAMLKQARVGQDVQINTVVLVDNADGLSFAIRRQFVETERYEVGGVAFIELTLMVETDSALVE